MSLITESTLKSFGKKNYSTASLSAGLESYRSGSKTNKTTIFLSHKHDDKEYLSNTIDFLEHFGVSIYVDWLDEEMPKTTSGETAKKIKDKIKQNDKFILLATEEAINSKWCNWELGLGDAEKYEENIALFPVGKDNRIYTGSEYLNIYPHIIHENGSNKYKNGLFIPKGYYILYPDRNVITPLKDWLKK